MHQADSDDLTWSWEGTVAAERGVYCEATAYNGVFDGIYDSTMELRVRGGGFFTVHSWGRFKSSSWSKVDTKCSDIPLDKLPQGVEVKTLEGKKTS